MTADDRTVLQTYLRRRGVISDDEFEEWLQMNMRTRKGKTTVTVVLAEAKAYALGCADVLLQKEVMAATYDGILQNLARELIAERASRQSVAGGWLYLPVGPEGPRPWPDS